MKITKVEAIAVNVPVAVDVVSPPRTTNLAACLVRIDTDEGHTGWGFTAITEEEVIAAAINHVAGPALIGADPLATEKIWDQLYWLMAPRGQTGYALHAIAAIDIALWDIKGKALGQPVWRLLGGARSKVPVYATFGFPFFKREELGDLAKRWVAAGFDKLKMTVGDRALRQRDRMPMDEAIRESAARVRTVREAVGDGIGLYVDGNCNLDPFHAVKLAHMIEPYDITFFEEPITQNDVLQMADMRKRTSIPLACGQNEGLAYRFRDLMVAGAVDVRPAQCRDHWRLFAVREDRRHGGGFQCRHRQWRRLAVPQHAPACRRVERRHGRVSLHRDRMLQTHLQKSA